MESTSAQQWETALSRREMLNLGLLLLHGAQSALREGRQALNLNNKMGKKSLTV